MVSRSCQIILDMHNLKVACIKPSLFLAPIERIKDLLDVFIFLGVLVYKWAKATFETPDDMEFWDSLNVFAL